MATADLTAARLRELLHYDPASDVWTRIGHKMRPDCAGKPITKRDENGYLRAMVDGRLHRFHRLVWLWHKGEMPSLHIDHIDGNPRNNRIENLREATRAVNSQNQRRLHDNNTSGFAGVHYVTTHRKFMARIGVGPKRIFLGYFDDPSSAYAAYIDAKRRLHPGNTL